MASPGGREVGRISIRVLPDTSKFDSELRAYLKSAEAKHNLNIDLEVDTAAARAEIREATAEAGDIEVDVDANTAQARSEISALMRDRRRVNIELNADTERLRAEIAAATRGKNRVEIQFDPNVRRLRRELARLALQRERVEIAVEPDIRRANLALAAWRRFQAARPLTIAINLAGNFTSILGSLTKFSAITVGIGGITSAVLAAGALVGELFEAAGAAALIPAALGGLVGIVGTLIIGFQGMGDALSAVMSGDVEALAEAMEGLAPSAQEAVTAFGGLREQLGGIREHVQQNLFAGMAGEISNLSVNLLPALEVGLGNVATGLGDIMEQSLATFGSGGVAAQIQSMLSNIGAGLSGMRPAVDSLIQAFSTLGQVGSTYFPQFAQWISDISANFNEWISAAAADGRLNQWIETALGLFQELGSIIGSVGGIFSGLADAAEGAGLSVVGSLDSGLAKFDEFVNSTQGQEIFTGLFDAATKIGSAVLPVLGVLGDLAVILAPHVASLAEELGPVLAGALEEIGPLLPPIIDAIAEMAPDLADLAVKFAEVAAPIIEKLLPHVGTLADLFTDVLETVEPLVDPLMDLVEAAVDLGVAIGRTLMPILEGAVALLGPIVEFIAQVVRWITEALEIVTGAADTIFKTVWGLDLFGGAGGGEDKRLSTFGKEIGENFQWSEDQSAEALANIIFGVDNAAEESRSAWSEVADGASTSWGDVESSARGALNGMDQAVADSSATRTAQQQWADLGAKIDVETEKARISVITRLTAATAGAARESLEMSRVIDQNLSAAHGHVISRMDNMRSTIERSMANIRHVAGSESRTLARLFDAQFQSMERSVRGSTMQMATVLSASMARMSAVVRSSLRAMAGAVRSEMSYAANAMLSGARQMVVALDRGLSSLGSVARRGANQVVLNLDVSGRAYAIGQNISASFASGIRSNAGAAVATAQAAAARVAAAMRAALDINSPSRVAEEIGKNVMLGLSAGMTGNLGVIDSAAESIADRLVKVGPRLSPLNGLSGQWSPHRGGSGVQVDVHPAPGMDEEQLATATANELAWRSL